MKQKRKNTKDERKKKMKMKIDERKKKRKYRKINEKQY